MFNSVSWQEFSSAVSVIAGCYYVIASLLLYSQEIINIFTQKDSKQIVAEVRDDQNNSNESIDLMGEIKYESQVNVPHEIIVESEEVITQSLTIAEEPITLVSVTLPEVALVNSLAELTQEIKLLVATLPGTSKEDIVLLFQHFLSRYPQLVQTSYCEAINLVISNSINEGCSIHFDTNEIKSWWPKLENV